MGLDSRLTFFSTLSAEKLQRYEGKNTRDIPLWGIDEEDFRDARYDNVRKYYSPIKVIQTTTDSDKLKKYLGVPNEAYCYLMGPNYIGFKSKDGYEKVFQNINALDKQWEIDKEIIMYFAETEDVYVWSRNERQEAIRELFDKEFPEEWCEYAKKYRQVYDKYYAVTPDLYKKMCKLDYEFAQKYDGYLNNVYYSCDY